MLGEIISAGSKLLGGYLQGKAAQKQSDINYARQKEFASHGIRWKVKDALAAGVHPLYALGASTTSYAPSSLGGSSGIGAAMGDMGQDISRAINATRTSGERADALSKTAEALTLKNMELKNEMLASQIAQIKAAPNPPMPGDSPVPLDKNNGQPSGRKKLYMGGTEIRTDPGTSSAQDYEDRYGDDGPGSWLPQLGIMWNDFKKNYGDITPSKVGRSVYDGLQWIDKNVKVFSNR